MSHRSHRVVCVCLAVPLMCVTASFAQASDLDRELVRIRDQVAAEELDVEAAIAQLKKIRAKNPKYPRVHIYLAKFDPSERDAALTKILQHTAAFPKSAGILEREFALQNPEMMPRLVKLLPTDQWSLAAYALSVDLHRSIETIEQLYEAPGERQVTRRVRLLTALNDAFVPPELQGRVGSLLRRAMASEASTVRFHAIKSWIPLHEKFDAAAWNAIRPHFADFNASQRGFLVRTATRMRDTPHVHALLRLALRDKDLGVRHDALAGAVSRLPYAELREHLLAALEQENPSLDAAWHYVREPKYEAAPKLESALERMRARTDPSDTAVLSLALARCDRQHLAQALIDIRSLLQISRRYVRSRRELITWAATFGKQAASLAPDLRQLAEQQPKCYSNVAIALSLLQLQPDQPGPGLEILRQLLNSQRPTSGVPSELPYAVDLGPLAADVVVAVREGPLHTLYFCRSLAPFLDARRRFDAALRDRLAKERQAPQLSAEGRLIQSWLDEESP